MTKEQVIERFCALATEVGEAHQHTLAHDCFCGHPDSFRTDPMDFRFEVLDFIESAVREKLAEMKS
jgi:hypothetical protein